MTLMEIATTHQMHRHVSVFDQWQEDHWQPCWVPFLSNGGGDYLCVATESYREIPVGSVLWYDHEVIDRESVRYAWKRTMQLERIRRKLETRQVSLNPPISTNELNAFERMHGIALPAGYRSFLLTIGDGGIGPPSYGLAKLGGPPH